MTECRICGESNPPEAKFCASCGASLGVTVEPPEVAEVGPAAELPLAVSVGQYAGFWIRLGAALIDAVLVGAVSSIFGFVLMVPGLYFTGLSYPVGFLLFLLYYWLLTGLRGQTVGKMAVGIKVVNAKGNTPGLGYAALREIPGKIVSTIGLFIGFFWVGLDPEKQGWHDKIAGTYVVSTRTEG